MSLPRTVRKTIFWFHLIAGLAAGLVILLLATTGFLLTYERQILAWQDGYSLAAPPSGQPSLPLEELAAKVLATHQGPPLTAISRDAGAGEPFVFSFGKEKQLFVDPFTGAELGEGSPRLRGFFSFVTSLHRWLALQGGLRDAGKAVTGTAALFFLFLVISGLFMWWPGRWTWQHLKRILFFQPRLHGPARDWNWHNVLGFWLCLPLLVIILSGIVMSFDWANQLLHRLAGSPPPPAKTASSPAKGGTGGNAPAISLAGLDRAWDLASGKVTGWQSINLRLPAKSGDSATFTISTSHRGRPDLKSQLAVELSTGTVRSFETFSTYSRGKQWRFWVRWLHTGEAGGVWGQTLAGLAALGAIMLVWTGFALSWRRFTRRRSAAPALKAPGTGAAGAVP